ncbi:spore germination protein [Bacillus spizizenii]|uniref:spore germination protein n=1 Tax=Bacillus spizizenii TaxID=96241 RepID=UPI0002EF79A5|nr:spore germination protein [Bacillus spizizenii]MEC1436155.1 spore germination protein [Bacillus spizizenii]MEC1585825.1 spore germination protein [Bacillus spizizenii]GEK24829.1 spore germination protein B1 [Bacillus spizizenii]
MQIDSDLQHNVETLKKKLGQNDDIIFYTFSFGDSRQKACLLYIDGLTENKLLAQHVISPLQKETLTQKEGLIEDLSAFFFGYRHSVVSSINEIQQLVFSGQAILLADGYDGGLAFDTKTIMSRNLEEPTSEVLERGPKIGFIEKLRTNTALLRERTSDPNLVIKEMTIGKRTKKKVAVAYIQDIAPDYVVKEVFKRLKSIMTDDVPESGSLEQLIEDEPFSVFPTILSTERPDRVESSLLEGRVSILVDGTPFALIVPATVDEFIHSPDDYNQRWIPMSLIRLIRYTSILITIYLPGLYISLVTYHTGLLPTRMAISIAGSRLNVPFPPFVEAFNMIFTIELIREAGLRLPKPIGQTIGFVGGVVIGQVAVQGQIVSALMVIVVSITALASFTVPSYAYNFPLRIIRIAAMLSAAVLGMYGVIMVFLLVIGHLMRLKSFGQDYIIPIMAQPGQDLKDTVIRVPTIFLKRRPTRKGTKDKIRQR